VLKRSVSFAALSLAVLASCEPPAPLVPFEIALVAPPPTSQAIATIVVAPPTFEVRTESGKAIKNVDVTVTTNANSGMLANAPVKTGSAPTPIGTWSLGTTPGPQSVTVSAEGLTPLVITVTAVPGAPAAISLLAGNNQFADSNTALAGPITVQVTDAFLNGIAGVTVNWAVTAGGGNLSALTSVSNASGVATAPTWTLGVAGTQTLQASVGAVTENVNAVVQTPPVAITLETPAPSTSLLGTTLDPAPTFKVRDALGNALPNVPVSVTVSAGGGVLNGAPTHSVAGGEATGIGSWSLGNSLGVQSVTVSVVGVPPLVISTTAATFYDLEVVFTAGPPAAEVATAFANAVTRIKSIVVGQLSSQVINQDISGCVTGFGVLTDTIHGLRIYASFPNIDGVGGVLGSAGPCYLRPTGFLPIIGRMNFDAADVSNMTTNGSLESVILHEMLHVLGMTGSMWDLLGVKSGTALVGGGGSTPMFTGTQARTACISENGGTNTCATFVPIEDCRQLDGITARAGCGTGTINSHWHELRFGNELMTGFASAGLNPFSRMTIGALADMGYTVNFAGSDAYMAPLGFMAPFSTPQVMITLPEPSKPIGTLNAQGKVDRIFEY
jgi:hypothetical protein